MMSDAPLNHVASPVPPAPAAPPKPAPPPPPPAASAPQGAAEPTTPAKDVEPPPTVPFETPSRSAPWMSLDVVEIRAIVQDARWQAGLSTQAHFSSAEAGFPQPTPRTVQVAASAAEIRSLKADVAHLIGDPIGLYA